MDWFLTLFYFIHMRTFVTVVGFASIPDASNDLDLVNGNFIFPDETYLTQSQTLLTALEDELVDEGEECFTIKLESGTDAADMLGPIDTAQVCVLDKKLGKSAGTGNLRAIADYIHVKYWLKVTFDIGMWY